VRGRILKIVGKKSFELPPAAQEIVDTLQEVLGAAVALIDAHSNQVHLRMSRGWFSASGTGSDLRRDGCHVEVAFAERWTIFVAARPGSVLPPDAERVVTWAGRKLAAHLPDRSTDDLPYPPTGGDGGPSGSAEVGIPVRWARRTRN
jgi:hypothetical protein